MFSKVLVPGQKDCTFSLKRKKTLLKYSCIECGLVITFSFVGVYSLFSNNPNTQDVLNARGGKSQTVIVYILDLFVLKDFLRFEALVLGFNATQYICKHNKEESKKKNLNTLKWLI